MSRRTHAPATSALALLAASSLFGCAGTRQAPAWQARASPGTSDAPVRDRADAPFAPRPGPGQARLAVAAPVEADRVQARQTALAFATALLDGDAQALSLLLDEQVTLIAEGARKVRRDVVTACLGERPNLGYRVERRLESVVDTSQVPVVRAGTEGVPSPAGARPSDLAVQLTPAAGAAGSGPRIPCLGTVYVRPGARPMIVAVMR